MGVVRKEIEGILEATKSTRETVVHICETGKAHTMGKKHCGVCVGGCSCTVCFCIC